MKIEYLRYFIDFIERPKKIAEFGMPKGSILSNLWNED